MLASIVEALDLHGAPDWVCDAYLEPWTSYAPEERLRADFAIAMSIAQIIRALNCDHMIRNAGPEQLAPWLPLVGDFLGSWLDHHVGAEGDDYWIEALVKPWS